MYVCMYTHEEEHRVDVNIVLNNKANKNNDNDYYRDYFNKNN